MSRLSLEVRQARREDIPAVLALYAQPDYDDGNVLAEEQAQSVFTRMADYPFYRMYVAISDAEIVGVFTLLVMINIGHMGAPSAIVESVAVAPHCQGKGIGRFMMDHAVAIARGEGCYKLSLSSNRRRKGAHAFYERLGFRQHGVSFLVDLSPDGQAANAGAQHG